MDRKISPISKREPVQEQGRAPKPLMRPDQIKAVLDRKVIGQEDAKKTLAVAVYNHYKRIRAQEDPGCGVRLDKSNVILLGPTGCGKTLLVRTIAEALDVPCYIQDCTKITASGYVGSDVEDCLAGLLRSCGYDLSKAERGIVMLDEGDKIARREAGPSITRDVSGECVQQSLLKIVEGDLVGVPPMGGRKHPEQPLIYVNTKNILFILSGAFVGLEEIVARRTGRDARRIGYAAGGDAGQADGGLSDVSAQDLREFGFIPEFTGRFPVITHVDPLDEEALRRILTEPQDSLEAQYTELLREDGVSLSFSDEAIAEVAREAFSLETGARGLRSILEKVMLDIMFEAPRKARRGCREIVIGKEDILRKTRKEIRKAE